MREARRGAGRRVGEVEDGAPRPLRAGEAGVYGLYGGGGVGARRGGSDAARREDAALLQQQREVLPGLGVERLASQAAENCASAATRSPASGYEAPRYVRVRLNLASASSARWSMRQSSPGGPARRA